MKAFLLIIAAGLGVYLIADGRVRTQLLVDQSELNPLELKQSPYGEIIGAALQEPVHLLSHGGVGHEHVAESHEGCAGCATCSGGDVSLGPGHGHSHDHEVPNVIPENEPWLALRKAKLMGLESKIRQNHNPGRRTVDVRAYEQKRMHELVELAYAMDPTNVGNYMMYVNFEGGRGGFEKIFEISQKSLRLTEGKLNDPNDSLTAAAAAEMIMIYRNIHATRQEIDNPDLEADYVFFVEKVEQFAASFDKSLEEGRLRYFSQEKVDEMLVTYNRFDWTKKAYKKYLEERE